MGISVLMSIYEKENPDYFAEAMDSILNQTLLPDEIVLVEDGPLTDELDKVIRRYQEKCPMLRVYSLEENVMLGRSLSYGLEQCTHELIARMDTDDIMIPERLERQSRFMQQHDEISVCGGFIEEFNTEGTYHKVKQMPSLMREIKEYAKYRNPVNHMTVMFRKADVLAAGNYRHFPFLEDYDLWIRMLAKGYKFHNLPQILVRARTGSQLYSRRGGWNYCKQYQMLRKEQNELGVTSKSEYLKGSAISVGITLQPAFVRKMIYQKVLRK